MNFFSVGLIGPEYLVFGTNSMFPEVSNFDSFHGPSTTCHSGLVA